MSHPSSTAASSAIQAVNQVLLHTLEEKENELNSELNKLNHLDDKELVSLRKERLRQLQERKDKERIWKANGHGEYAELSETKEFFSFCQTPTSENVLVHFYTTTNQYSVLLHRILRDIAYEHLEIKIGYINAEKVPFLVTRFQIRVIPALVLCQKGEIYHILHGLDEITATSGNSGSIGNVTKKNMKRYLLSKKMIQYNQKDYEEEEDDNENEDEEEESNSIGGRRRTTFQRIDKRSIRQGKYCNDDD